jgi:tRNA pseudouridine38-40 synthase
LRFDIRANAFCHQMVRSIVGTLVEVGIGKLHAGDMRGIMLNGRRQAAGQVAPPHGLVLWEVGYA